MQIRNRVRERLDSGELAIGMGLRQSRDVDIGKVAKSCGFDWLFIDMEHSTMSVDWASRISVAAQDAGVTPIVRVPGMQHYHATRVLDGGAMGIVVPHVDTAEQAAKVVDNCRYPPVGHRSITGALPQIDFQSLPAAEATAAIDRATLLIVMIETPTAVENVESIAAVPGIDILLVGTNDLCLEMGIPGQIDSPQIAGAYERIIAACKANNKFAGLGGVYEPTLMTRYTAMGMPFVLAGSDLSFMMAMAKQRVAGLRD